MISDIGCSVDIHSLCVKNPLYFIFLLILILSFDMHVLDIDLYLVMFYVIWYRFMIVLFAFHWPCSLYCMPIY